MKALRVAMAVMHSPVSRIERNLARMAHWTSLAVQSGAQVICFPELNVTGYTTRARICTTALTVPGPVSDRICQMAADSGITILAGLAEQSKTGKVYATHEVATPDGRIARYRKLHLSPPEQKHFVPGRKLPLFELHGFCFGIQLCYDAHFPELSTHMALEGADAIFVPHASPRVTPREKFDSWMRHLPARAYDNALYVLACNQTGNNGLGLDFAGLSLAIDPAGKLAASDLSGDEGLLMVTLHKAALQRVRNHRMRYFLPNRRPDLYRRR
jgi:N-carbamoylputrescine amidase